MSQSTDILVRRTVSDRKTGKPVLAVIPLDRLLELIEAAEQARAA